MKDQEGHEMEKKAGAKTGNAGKSGEAGNRGMDLLKALLCAYVITGILLQASY